MTKSRQALCSVTAVALLPEASNHKQEHIILSKEDLLDILEAINHTTFELQNLLPHTDSRHGKLNDYRTKLRQISNLCKPTKDQPNGNNMETT